LKNSKYNAILFNYIKNRWNTADFSTNDVTGDQANMAHVDGLRYNL